MSTMDTHVCNPFSPYIPSTPLLQGFDVNDELQVTHWAEQSYCCMLNLNARIPSLNQDSHTNITITTLKARASRIERPTALLKESNLPRSPTVAWTSPTTVT